MEQAHIDIRVFQSFLNALQDPACYVSSDGRVLYRNGKAEQLQIFKADHPFRDTLPLSETAPFTQNLDQALRGNIECRYTVTGESDGSDLTQRPDIEFSISPINIGRMIVGMVTRRERQPKVLNTVTNTIIETVVHEVYGPPTPFFVHVPASSATPTPDREPSTGGESADQSTTTTVANDDVIRERIEKQAQERAAAAVAVAAAEFAAQRAELEARVAEYHARLLVSEAKVTSVTTALQSLQEIIDQCPDLILTVDRNLIVTTVNGHGREQLTAGMIGVDAPTALSPDDMLANRQAVETCLSTGKPTVFRSRYRPAGSEQVRWRQSRVVPSRTDNPTHAYVFSTDIQDVIVAEQESAAANRLFRSIMDHAPVAITLKDPTGHYVQASAFAAKLLGKKRSDIPGKTDRDLMPSSTADSVRHNDKESARARRPHSTVESLPSASGETATLHTVRIPIIDDNDTLAAICTIGIDITAQKTAEDNARLFRAVVESSRELLALADEQGKPVFVNKAGAETFGFGSNSTNITEFVSPAHAQLLRKEVLPAVLKTGHRWEGEVEFVSRNVADAVPGSLRIVPIANEDGKNTWFGLAGADLTSRVAAQKALAEAAKMASLGAMAGGIAHEINNPLAIIYGKSCQIRKLATRGDITPDELGLELEKVEQTAVRISKLIKALRSFARNAERDPMIDVPLATVLQDTLAFCKERFRNHGVDLHDAVSTDALVHCNALQITQVLLNLLNNAFDSVQYLPQKWIDLQITEENDKVAIAVTDSARGVSPGVVERMMEPFYAATDASRAGLGLNVAKDIVERHGGRLYYEPQDGHARFVVELKKIGTTGSSTPSPTGSTGGGTLPPKGKKVAA